MEQLVVDRNRTNVVVVDLNEDVSADTFTSEIRKEQDWNSTLLATWTVTFVTDGTDGELLLTLDKATTSAITLSTAYMDIKRVNGSEETSVLAEPIQVVFQGTVTQ